MAVWAIHRLSPGAMLSVKVSVPLLGESVQLVSVIGWLETLIRLMASSGSLGR